MCFYCVSISIAGLLLVKECFLSFGLVIKQSDFNTLFEEGYFYGGILNA